MPIIKFFTALLISSFFFVLGSNEKDALLLTWAQMRKMPHVSQKTPELQKLENQIVKISGFMVALEGSEKGIKDFLLVPVAGMCIHLPPPPPNQSVYVRMKGNTKADHSWESVRVVGKLSIKVSDSEFGDSYFFIEADKVY